MNWNPGISPEFGRPKGTQNSSPCLTIFGEYKMTEGWGTFTKGSFCWGFAPPRPRLYVAVVVERLGHMSRIISSSFPEQKVFFNFFFLRSQWLFLTWLMMDAAFWREISGNYPVHFRWWLGKNKEENTLSLQSIPGVVPISRGYKTTKTYGAILVL